MRNTKRILAAAMALLLAVSLLAGCGKASNTAFQVVFAGAYTSEAEAAAYGEQLAVEAEPPSATAPSPSAARRQMQPPTAPAP